MTALSEHVVATDRCANYNHTAFLHVKHGCMGNVYCFQKKQPSCLTSESSHVHRCDCTEFVAKALREGLIK